jgi:hypothetical protein
MWSHITQEAGQGDSNAAMKDAKKDAIRSPRDYPSDFIRPLPTSIPPL